MTPTTAPTASEPDRRYTRRLSELFASGQGTLALAMLQKLRASTGAAAPAPVLPRPDGSTVGIWRRNDGEDGDYVRATDLRPDWRYWADVDRLPLRTGRRRVALLGESAARGYFYDPATTCASLLEDCLRRLDGLADVDVLDLARTNATQADLTRTLLEVAGLEPDALVVFAGNNWNNVDLTPDQLQQLADAVRTGGYAAGQRVFQGYVVAAAGRLVDTIAAVGQVVGAPVVLVVPEFNLADWRDERSLVCPVLPGSTQRDWLTARERARAATDPAAAAQAAAEMIRLDGGTSPVSQLLLADALADTDPVASAAARVAAKDAAVGIFAPHSPRALTAVQQEMRRKADEHGFAVVDLATELRAAAGGATPGRRFFLDYCHLSAEGLTRLAAGTANALAPLLGGTPAEVAELCAAVPPPARAHAATAHFLAAVHNAHYGQSAEIVTHHLARALELDGGVGERLREYLDYQTRTAPHWMCASYERAAAVPELARYLEVADTRLSSKLADHELREAAVRLLADAGTDVADWYEELLVAEHARPEVDLLADANRATTFRERLGHTPGGPRSYLVAYDLDSEFHLVLARPQDGLLTATWRLPDGEPATGTVEVFVNDAAVGAVELGGGWTTTRLDLPARLLRRGRNVVRLRWPLRALPGDELLAAAAECLERGALPDSLPGHGHVFALTVEGV